MQIKATWSKELKCGLKANVLATDISNGDLSIAQPVERLHTNQRELIATPWCYLKQVHGANIIRVQAPGQYQGKQGDGMVSTGCGIPMSIQVADCAPVALISETEVLGIVHAGWRGLLSGVIDNACSEMINLGGHPTTAVVGPCISPEYYEFGVDALKLLERQFGSEVRSRTKHGAPSLDIPKTVHVALTRNDVRDIFVMDQCTATSDKHWSYRVGKDEKRQAMIAWLEETV